MSDPPGTITDNYDANRRGESTNMNKNDAPSIVRMFALPGLVALAACAFVLWIIAPTDNTGGIAPEAPVSTTTFWVIVASGAAIVLLVLLPVAMLLGPRIIRRRYNRPTNPGSPSQGEDTNR